MCRGSAGTGSAASAPAARSCASGSAAGNLCRGACLPADCTFKYAKLMKAENYNNISLSQLIEIKNFNRITLRVRQI